MFARVSGRSLRTNLARFEILGRSGDASYPTRSVVASRKRGLVLAKVLRQKKGTGHAGSQKSSHGTIQLPRKNRARRGHALQRSTGWLGVFAGRRRTAARISLRFGFVEQALESLGQFSILTLALFLDANSLQGLDERGARRMLMLNEMMNGMCVLMNRGMLRWSWLSRMLLHELQLVLHRLQLIFQTGNFVLQIRFILRRPSRWRTVLRTCLRAINDQQSSQHERTHQELLHGDSFFAREVILPVRQRQCSTAERSVIGS